MVSVNKLDLFLLGAPSLRVPVETKSVLTYAFVYMYNLVNDTLALVMFGPSTSLTMAVDR